MEDSDNKFHDNSINRLEFYNSQDIEDLSLNYHQDIINKALEDMLIKKLKLVISRLESMNIRIDLYEELNRRFKLISSDIVDGLEAYYYNDGSLEGMEIMKFYPPVIDEKSGNGLLAVEFLYC